MFSLRRAIKLALLFTSLVLSSISALPADSKIILSDPSILRKGFVDISQRWDYYNSVLVDPEEFYPTVNAGPSAIVNLPHTMRKGVSLGTYHIRISGLIPYNRYSCDMYGALMTSSRIWCNGKIVATGGFLSKHKDMCKSGDIFNPVDFQADQKGVVDIVIHIANFSKCKGGIVKQIKMSEISALRRRLTQNYFLNALILAFMVAHILYNILLGSLNIRQHAYTIVTIICACYCAAITLTGHSLLLSRGIELPFWLHRKLPTLILCAVTAIDVLYIMGMMKAPAKRTKILFGIGIGNMFLAMVLPLGIFESFRWLFVDIAMTLSLINFLAPIKFVLRRTFDSKHGIQTTTIAYNISTLITLVILLCRARDFLFLPQKLSPIHSFMTFKLSILLFGITQCGVYAFNRDFSFIRVTEQMDKLSFTNNTLAKIVPPQVLKLLGAADITKIIPGECRIIDAILFYVEIKHFNRLAESIEKEELYSIQTEVFKAISPIINDSGGFVAKYTMSGCLAIFQHKNADAITCASRLQKKIRDVRRDLRKKKRTDISIGVAIHAGKAAVGTIGSSKRLDTIALSEDVNIAFAVGKQTSKTNTQILITEEAMPYCRSYINYVYEGHYFISNGNQILVYSALPIKKSDQSYEDTLEPIEDEDEI
ncbi:MAG: hypothetical protein IK015_11585 [Treponema sp.]|nr:hypothetical protein [Treponema sp.]